MILDLLKQKSDNQSLSDDNKIKDEAVIESRVPVRSEKLSYQSLSEALHDLNILKLEESNVDEEYIEETYTDDELDSMIGKVYNLQKIESIYRRKKYDDSRLFAKTVCVNCGRQKRVFLSNLINDPEKYGSCICSDTNIDSKIDNIEKLYKGSKKLASNTSGYTGVSFVKSYSGKPYNKWRAYIEVDGVRTYLGDFDSKTDAVKARKAAGEKGVKWYKDNKNRLLRDMRKKTKKYSNSKYRDSKKPTFTAKSEKDK